MSDAITFHRRKHVVMKMKEVKPPRIGLVIGTLFRSLIRSGGFQWSAGSVEEFASTNIAGNNHYNHRKIKAAWLKSERKKAEAVNWSRRGFVC